MACCETAVCTSASKPRRVRKLGIPDEIRLDPGLKKAIEIALPPNYNFEVEKSVWKVRKSGAKHLGLQMPDGLLMYSTVLCDILRRFTQVEEVTVFGDVVFGACCIDDLACKAMGCDFLIHYGHSCLVPVDQTAVAVLYVHVLIDINPTVLVETVALNLPDPETRIAVMGTIQFVAGMSEAANALRSRYRSVVVPQIRPLSAGETLGCTAPKIDNADVVVFVADGRFHLEAAMIANPDLPFLRYDPATQKMSKESYAFDSLHENRGRAIEEAKKARLVGVILGTLGRQGSVGVSDSIVELLEKRGIAHFLMLSSEVLPAKLALFKDVDCFVQVACPRLSVDWGQFFHKPLLSSYEAFVAWGDVEYQERYPMDYYSNQGGAWSNYGTTKTYGGSLQAKFWHMSQRAKIAYDDEGEDNGDGSPST